MKHKTLLLPVKPLLLPLLLFMLLSGSTSVAQRAYYVDITKTTNGTGTIGSPWNNVLSAMYGSGQADTSDVTVYFRQGTYFLTTDTTVYIGSNKSGSNGHYFTLRAYPGEQVVFDGSRLKTNYSYMVSIAGANNIRLQGLTFANLLDSTLYGIYISGNSSNIDIRSCIFRNLLWNSDTAEAKFPGSGDKNIYPIYIAGASNLPTGVLIDTCRFVTIAPGYYASLVTVSGTAGTVTQTANVDSNIIYKKPRYEFYVSPSGNDTTGTGSKAKPWRTINYAVNGAGYDFSTVPPVLLDSNITIYLRNGTYPLKAGVYIGHIRGQNGKWFTVTNYPGEDPIVDGGGLTQKYSCLFIIDSAKNVLVSGLNLQNLTNDASLKSVDPLTGDTLKDVRYGIIISGTSSNIRIVNNDLYNMKWTRDTTKAKNPAPNDVLSAITVLGNTNSAIRGLLIDNNNVHNIVPGYAEGVTLNGNVDSFAITGNEIYDVANIGIVAAGNYKWVLNGYPTLLKANNQSRNGLIKDNSVYRCISPVALSGGIYLDGSRNVTVQGNESYNNGVGISVGNEQDSSTSGGHLIISNNLWDNLEAGIYLGSNNLTSVVDTVVVKYNTISHDFTINPSLYSRANGKYGTLDTAARGPEVVTNRIRHLTFDENEIYSSSDNVLAFAYSQSNLTFTYNEYYTQHNNACKAYFLRDTVGLGYPQKKDTTFHQYGSETGLDTTSHLGGTAYNRHGCGTHSTAFSLHAANSLGSVFDDGQPGVSIFPDPVINKLTVRIKQDQTGPVRLELWDLSGRILLRQDKQLAAGVNLLGWDNIRQAAVSPGVYILHITGTAQPITRKILVL
ncbi:right-handed parallel beta-helix repeat-containing protein [Flavitalea flava]